MREFQLKTPSSPAAAAVATEHHSQPPCTTYRPCVVPRSRNLRLSGAAIPDVPRNMRPPHTLTRRLLTRATTTNINCRQPLRHWGVQATMSHPQQLWRPAQRNRSRLQLKECQKGPLCKMLTPTADQIPPLNWIAPLCRPQKLWRRSIPQKCQHAGQHQHQVKLLHPILRSICLKMNMSATFE